MKFWREQSHKVFEFTLAKSLLFSNSSVREERGESAITGRTLKGSSRTRADSITDNRARLSGERKKFDRNVSVIVVFY